MTIFVHLEKGLGMPAYRERWERGLEPDASPYGFHLAEEMGARLIFSSDDHSRTGVARLLHRLCLRVLRFDLMHAWANRRAIGGADIVWTMLEREGLGVLALMKLRFIPRRPTIASVVWMVNRWETLGWWRRRLFRRLMTGDTLVTVHARPCLDRLADILPGVPARLLRFGINADSFKGLAERPRAEGEPISIVGVGNDTTRDWRVLLEAFGDDPRVELTIVNPAMTQADVAAYNNVTVPTGMTMERFRALYLSATYVAVPMRPNLFSGITVALECAVAGTPILCSRTGGVPTYFAEDEVLYVPVDDPKAMREAVFAQSAAERGAMAKRAHHRFLKDDYSTRGMILRYAEATRALLPNRFPIMSRGGDQQLG